MCRGHQVEEKRPRSLDECSQTILLSANWIGRQVWRMVLAGLSVLGLSSLAAGNPTASAAVAAAAEAVATEVATAAKSAVVVAIAT